jgi:hypothetical protein
LTSDPSPSRLRKRPLQPDAAANVGIADEIDITGCATILYSSEQAAHPVEHLHLLDDAPAREPRAGSALART